MGSAKSSFLKMFILSSPPLPTTLSSKREWHSSRTRVGMTATPAFSAPSPASARFCHRDPKFCLGQTFSR